MAAISSPFLISALSCLCRDNRRGDTGLPGVHQLPNLLPLFQQSVPSCQPDPVTWQAAWGYSVPSLKVPGPVEAHRADICVQSKVTFVNAIGSCRD